MQRRCGNASRSHCFSDSWRHRTSFDELTRRLTPYEKFAAMLTPQALIVWYEDETRLASASLSKLAPLASTEANRPRDARLRTPPPAPGVTVPTAWVNVRSGSFSEVCWSWCDV